MKIIANSGRLRMSPSIYSFNDMPDALQYPSHCLNLVARSIETKYESTSEEDN